MKHGQKREISVQFCQGIQETIDLFQRRQKCVCVRAPVYVRVCEYVCERVWVGVTVCAMCVSVCACVCAMCVCVCAVCVCVCVCVLQMCFVYKCANKPINYDEELNIVLHDPCSDIQTFERKRAVLSHTRLRCIAAVTFSRSTRSSISEAAELQVCPIAFIERSGEIRKSTRIATAQKQSGSGPAAGCVSRNKPPLTGA